MKLSETKLRILDACADDPELFYFPFAEVNYGGQVSPGSRRGSGKEFFQRFEDDMEWPVEVPGEVVAEEIANLVRVGLLRCERITFVSEHDATRADISSPDENEFSVYEGYDCVTREEHFERFGYGPHEFTATTAGLEKLHESEVR